MKTAVEWMVEKLFKPMDNPPIENVSYIIEQTKEMEKQQIIDARVNGVAEGIDIGARPIGKPITEDISKNHEIYYNETFNK